MLHTNARAAHRGRDLLRLAVCLASVLGVFFAPGRVFAAPVNVEVIPTFQDATGVVEGYRAYRACDSAPVLVGPATSGQPFTFQWDTTNPDPFVSVRAFNSSGEGGGNCVELALNLPPPGDVIITVTCSLTVGGVPIPSSCVAN